MSRRGGGSVYEEREYYSREGPSPAPPAPAPVRTRERDYEEVDIYSRRERGPERDNRPEFLRDDFRRGDPGPLVVREREVDTYSRERRPRSPSPVRVVRETREKVVQRPASPPPPARVVRETRERVIQRSPSPPPVERVRTRVIERERERSPTPPPERLRARVVETRERVREPSPPSPPRTVYRERVVERERTPSPPPVRIRERIIERERERSPSPPRIEKIRISNFERERRPSPSPSPSPSPPPPIVRAPPIHQEIITHHRHIDHGFERAPRRAPSPPPPRGGKETDIDIHTSRGNTEIDIRQTSGRERNPLPLVRRERDDFNDDSSVVYERDDKLKVRDTTLDIRRSRSVSSRLPERERERERVRVDIRDDESEPDYYRRRTDERAYIGEAYNGATKDWAIVDVPPGTERVRMDGVGGGSEEVSWQRYNGVRRSKFIPERERERPVERERERIEIRDEPRREGTGMEIEISRTKADGGRYEREYERIEESSSSSDRRVGLPRPPPKEEKLWTEITKDLVTKEAIEQLGYDFEETEYFFYIIQYLRYEDVLEIVQLSEKIRRERQRRVKEIERERERVTIKEKERDEWEGFDRRREREAPYDDERIIEREIIYDGRRGTPRRSGW